MSERFEGKEFALRWLPLLCGISGGHLAAGKLSYDVVFGSCAAFCITIAVIAIFLSARPGRLKCLILLLLCGFFTSFCSSVPGIGGSGVSFRPAEFCVAWLRETIDLIPFEKARTNALLKALLTADRSSMSYPDRTLFRSSGASHLLALSGMHVGIIYLLTGKLFSIFGNSPVARKARNWTSIVLIAFFCLMTGCGPSITRAFLFVLLRETAQMLHRPCSLPTCLSGALCIQLILSPASIMEIGFQLSYLAMVGIAFIYPPLEKLYPASKGMDPIRKVWELSVLSISCQIMTAPVVFLKFHTFARHFLLTNILAAPLMTVTMVAGIASTGLYACGNCPDFIIWANERCCDLMYAVLETISSL